MTSAYRLEILGPSEFAVVISNVYTKRLAHSLLIFIFNLELILISYMENLICSLNFLDLRIPPSGNG